MTPLPYELARELKEAGFPQGGEGNYVNVVDARDPSWDEKNAYVPTLSELIDAVRKPEERDIELFLTVENDKTTAMFSGFYGTGSTPEEAVARLLLALNKK